MVVFVIHWFLIWCQLVIGEILGHHWYKFYPTQAEVWQYFKAIPVCTSLLAAMTNPWDNQCTNRNVWQWVLIFEIPTPWLVGFGLCGSWWDLREEQSCSKCEGVAGETHIHTDGERDRENTFGSSWKRGGQEEEKKVVEDERRIGLGWRARGGWTLLSSPYLL